MLKNILTASLLVVMSLPLTARASLITGVLNFTGSANITEGTVGFVGNVFGITAPASTQVGGFTALAGTSGTIINLSNPPDATGIPLDVPDFITFSAAPNISITLTYLFAGIDGAAGCSLTPPAAGQECTPNLPDQSPVNLQNTSSTSSTASIDVLGTEVDSLTGDTILVTGIFSTPFSTQSYQDILATIFGGGTVSTAFSAQFSTVSPEPGTLVGLAIGIGVIGIGLVYRKRSERA
jgi:hypothetical protein